jgi:UDP-N-acetylmuramoyl-L-alanyl-D-glutamate--2,6-diaminopimelate ligase
MELNHLIADLEFIGAVDDFAEITGLTFDSREVQSGSLYACMKGTKTDGHNFIPQAIAQGAEAVLCDKGWLNAHQKELSTQVSWLGVDNVPAALAAMAARFYGEPARSMTMVAVTGTNGKTTTSHLIQALLNGSHKPTALFGTLSYKFGDYEIPAQYTTPFAPELHRLFREFADRGAQAVVMETSSHALHQHRLDAIGYDVAVFTNLTQDHLDYHATMEAYRDAKQILFARLLKPTGTAVINLDDPAGEIYRDATPAQVITYAIDRDADLRAQAIVYQLAGVTFDVVFQGESYPMRLRLPGHYNVYNALAALGAALSQNIALNEAIALLEQVPGVPGRLEVVTPEGAPFTVVVDYAHTPDSLENVLKAARQFATHRVIAVFGCGGDRDRTKRPKMGAIADTLSDLAVVTSDNPRTEDTEAILQDILAGIQRSENLIVDVDRRSAIGKSIAAAQPGDVVVIAGKGHETYQIFKSETLHFDDREEARAALQHLTA